jgi:glycosyltransferase involved in cell wall biosynthesis
MHVIMLTNAIAPDKLGGLERYVRDLSAQLVKRGVEVTVVAKTTRPDSPNRENCADGVRIVRYSPPSKTDPLFAMKYPRAIARGVNAAIRDVGYAGSSTFIHGHFPVPMIPIVMKRTPFLYTCHAPLYRELLEERQGSYALPRVVQPIAVTGLRGLERKIVRRARHVLTLSRFLRDEVAQLDPEVGRSVTIVPGGVDLRRFTRRPDAHLPRPVDRKGPVVFVARRLVSRTGVEQLVDAFALVAPAHPEATLVVAGDGSRRDFVRQRIHHHGLDGRVQMVGYVSDEELVEWYQSVDVAVTPTQELEGFGLATAEAMACGAVPLVTPVGANGEVVAGLPGALISKSAAAEDIASALIGLLNDAPMMRKLRGDVVAEHAQQFGWDRVIDKHLALYRGADNQPR